MANTKNVVNHGPIFGFNKRLEEFRALLASSNFHRLRDPYVVALLLRYAKDKDAVISELKYLDGVRVNGLPWCQSIKQAEQLKDQILAFAMPDHANFSWNRYYQESLEAMIREFSSWHLRPEFFHSMNELKESLPKEDTHSGYLFLETGRKEKGENLDEMFTSYREAVDAVKQGRSIPSFPILPGCRTQGSGVYDSDGRRTPAKAKMKTRLVSMIDARTIAVELMFSHPFQLRYADYQRYAGGKSDNRLHTLVYDKGHYANRWLSLDYSRYDQSISSWLIRDAFQIVAAAFDLNDWETRMLGEVVRIFTAKEFVTPHGMVRSTRGVPSGSMFTQIIDSLVNELMIRTVMSALSIKKYDMIIMGDDNLLFYESNLPLGEQICSYLTHNFGITANASKLSSGMCADANFEFLSRTWKREGAYRHPNILLSKLVYPERYRDYDSGDVSSEEIIYSYCLAYPIGMKKLMDVDRFMNDFRGIRSRLESRRSEISGYLSGYLRYQFVYLKVRDSDYW
jgi:hypothetical protein